MERGDGKGRRSAGGVFFYLARQKLPKEQRAAIFNDKMPREPMCASCKVQENVCFYSLGQVCLGMVTRAGCGAKCVTLGRPCTGCRGIAEDANLASARLVLAEHGMLESELGRVLQLYNAIEEAR